MPAVSKAQQRAAALELGRRDAGQKREKKATRPFGSASREDLEEFTKSGGKDLPARKQKDTVFVL